MNRSGFVTLCVLATLLALYIGGYVAYRHYRPIGVHYPRRGGTPGLLVNTETREYELLAKFFDPCIRVENFYHARER
jgi:hypothetical protein